MNRSKRRLAVMLGTVALCASAVLYDLAHAQAQSRSSKDEIVGTWSAVSQYVDQDGKKLEPLD